MSLNKFRMNLYLMRHGDALPVGGAVLEDVRRPLSPPGCVQVRKAAEALRQKEAVVDAVVSSPLVRAKETAAIVAEVMGVDRAIESPVLAPSASPVGLQGLLASHAHVHGLLWVAHHPDVTLWTAYLTGLDPSVCPLFGTASVAALWIEPAAKKAEFLWFQP